MITVSRIRCAYSCKVGKWSIMQGGAAPSSIVFISVLNLRALTNTMLGNTPCCIRIRIADSTSLLLVYGCAHQICNFAFCKRFLVLLYTHPHHLSLSQLPTSPSRTPWDPSAVHYIMHTSVTVSILTSMCQCGANYDITLSG